MPWLRYMITEHCCTSKFNTTLLSIAVFTAFSASSAASMNGSRRCLLAPLQTTSLSTLAVLEKRLEEASENRMSVLVAWLVSIAREMSDTP